MAKSTTFRGKPKPYGASGHFDEPVRHKLQGMGINTGHLAAAPILNPYHNINTDSLTNILARIPTKGRRDLFLAQFNNLSAKDKKFVVNILKDTDGDKAIDLFDCNPYDPTKQDLKEFVARATEKIGKGAIWIGKEAKIGFEKAKEGGQKVLEWVKKEGSDIKSGFERAREKLAIEQEISEARAKLEPVPDQTPGIMPSEEKVYDETQITPTNMSQIQPIREEPSLEPTPTPEPETTQFYDNIPAEPYPPKLSEPSPRRQNLERDLDQKAERILTMEEELQLQKMRDMERELEEKQGLIRPSIFSPVNVWSGEKVKK